MTSLNDRLTGFPAAGIVWATAAAFLLGVPCGYFHSPYWPVVVIGLAGAALSLRLEWDALTRLPGGARRTNIGPQLAAAYGFLCLVAIGVASLGYFLGEWLHRH